MKRKLSIFLCVIFIITLLAGCSGTNKTQVSQGNSTAPASTQDSSISQQGSTTSGTEAQKSSGTAADSVSKNNSTANTSSTAVKQQTSTVPKSTKTSSSAGAKASSKTAAAPSLQDVLNSAVAYYKNYAAAQNYKIGDWDAITLKMAGVDINSAGFKKNGSGYIEYKAESINKEIDSYYLTDYARSILGIMAAGYDPSNFNGLKLVDNIKNSSAADGKFQDTITGGEDLLNCHVWGMIALDAAKVQYDRTKALQYIEAKQNKDGGFYIFSQAPSSDTDFTGMTVIALTMAGRDKNSPSVSKALGYLKSQLKVFEKNPSLETSETLSTIIEAVVSAKDDINSYKVNGKNVVDELISFRKANGGFSHLKGGASNDISTRQALMALEFYKNNKNLYENLSYTKGSYFVSNTQNMSSIEIWNAVYDVKTGNIEFEAKVENLDDAVIDISDGKNTESVKLVPSNGLITLEKSMPNADYNIAIKGERQGSISAIANISAEKIENEVTATVRVESYDKTVLPDTQVTLGNTRVFDWDGNSFNTGKISAYAFVMKALMNAGIPSYTSYSYGSPYTGTIDNIAGGVFKGWDGWMFYVNGQDPNVGMSDAVIKDGDSILVYYADWGTRPLTISAPSQATLGQPFAVSVECGDQAVPGAAVWINGNKYITDDNGTVYVTENQAGQFEVYAEKNDDNGKPLFVRSDREIVEVK